MDMYMYVTRDVGLRAYDNAFRYISDLLRLGVINDKSTIWIDGENPTRGVWALTNKSSFITIYRPTQPGWARLTRTYVACGPTANGANKNANPDYVFNISDLGEGYLPHATIVIAHSKESTGTNIIHDGAVRGQVVGSYSMDPFTIIDPYKYRLDENFTPSEAERSLAFVNGPAYMAQSASPAAKKLVRENLEMFRVSFNEKDKIGMQDFNNLIEKAASSWQEGHTSALKNGNILDRLTSKKYYSQEFINDAIK